MRIRLFGGVEVTTRAGDGPIRFGTRKSSLLFAALVLAGSRGHRREKLSEAFWPGRGDAQSRNSLRQALADIRRSFPSRSEAGISIEGDQETVALVAAPDEADIWVFTQKQEQGTIADLAFAANLYRADLLGDVAVPDGLDEWFGPYQSLYQRKARHLVEQLSLAQPASGSAEELACETLAERLLAADPTSEAAHRALIRINANRGRENAALHQFEVCKAILKKHLGTEPEAQTNSLVGSLRKREGVKDQGASVSTQFQTRAPDFQAVSHNDRPSVAVLPFQNLSGDPKQDYFADGIVEDIVTSLAHFRQLFVIARNSSFAYRERAQDVTRIGQELGVGYIVEGSVRKENDRLRIAAQLLETSTGIHLWARRFDGTLADVFDLQDEIASSIVGAIAPKVEEAEIERTRRKPTEDLDAYDYYLRGLAVHDRAVTNKETIDAALNLFMKAVAHDGGFAAAYARAARCYATRKSNRWMADPGRETAEAKMLARKAVELGRDDALALSYGGYTLGYVGGDIEESAAFIDRALALNPNLAAAWGYSAWVQTCLGEPEKGLERAAQAMRLSPLDPRIFAWEFCTALAQFCAGRYNDAARWAKQSLRSQPNYASAMRVAAASYILAGQATEAEQMMTRLRDLDPLLRLSNLADVLPPFQRSEDRDNYVRALRMAGLPE